MSEMYGTLDGTELGFNPWTLKKEKVLMLVEIGTVAVGRMFAASEVGIVGGFGGIVD